MCIYIYMKMYKYIHGLIEIIFVDVSFVGTKLYVFPGTKEGGCVLWSVSIYLLWKWESKAIQ